MQIYILCRILEQIFCNFSSVKLYSTASKMCFLLDSILRWNLAPPFLQNVRLYSLWWGSLVKCLLHKWFEPELWTKLLYIRYEILTLLDSGGNSVGYFYIQYFVFSVPCLLLRLPDGLHWELVVKNQIEKDRLMWGHCTNSILTCNQLCPNQGATGISFFSENSSHECRHVEKTQETKKFLQTLARQFGPCLPW